MQAWTMIQAQSEELQGSSSVHVAISQGMIVKPAAANWGLPGGGGSCGS